MPDDTLDARPRRLEPVALARGKDFHRQVQDAFVANLLAVDPKSPIERVIVHPAGRRDRADILLLVSKEPERQRPVIEIKSTEWEPKEPTNHR
jgi:hypothetical protein